MKFIKLFTVIVSLLLLGSMQVSAESRTAEQVLTQNGEPYGQYAYGYQAGTVGYTLYVEFDGVDNYAYACAMVYGNGGYRLKAINISGSGYQYDNGSGNENFNGAQIVYAHCTASGNSQSIHVYAFARVTW